MPAHIRDNRGSNPGEKRTSHRTAGRGITIIGKRKAEGPPQADSWWARPEMADRDVFMATAYGKYPTVTPPIKFSIALNRSGRLDA